MNKRVELKPGYFWDCEDCGTENFERGGVPDLCEQDLLFLREKEGIDPDDVGHFTMVPTNVKCRKCGLAFTTTVIDVDGCLDSP